jgi:hypothetical protein
MSASPTILMVKSLSLEDPKTDYRNEEQTPKRMQSISDHTPTTSSAIHYKDYVQSLGDEDSSQHDEMNDDSIKGGFEDDEGSCSLDSIVVLENLRLVSNDERRSRSSIKNRAKQLNKDEADDCFEPLDYEDGDEVDSLVVAFKRKSMEHVTKSSQCVETVRMKQKVLQLSFRDSMPNMHQSCDLSERTDGSVF